MQKHKSLVTILIILLVPLLFSACGSRSYKGEYKYVGSVYRGFISSHFIPPPSESHDYVVEQNRDMTYTITKDSLIVEGADFKLTSHDLTFKKTKFKNEYIYGTLGFTDKRLDELFANYDKKEILLMYASGVTRIEYCFLFLDDDIFVAKTEKRGGVIYELDMIKEK